MNKSIKVEKFKTIFYVKASLISLYLALTFPIPFFTNEDLKITSIISFFIGLIVIISITDDYVLISDLSISYKTNIISNLLGKKNWEILWTDIVKVKSFKTSQGSKVNYFVNSKEDKILVPQRLEKFDEYKKIIETRTNIKDLMIISPIWTYKLLTFLSFIVWFSEILFIYLIDYQY